jgi:hypothetical protein
MPWRSDHDQDFMLGLASDARCDAHYPVTADPSAQHQYGGSPMDLVPIFGIFMIIAVVIGPVWITAYFRARERQQLHETLRTAYEKGQSPPPELIEKLTAGAVIPADTDTPDRDLRRAVVLIAVGVGLCGLGLCLGYGISFADSTGGWITGGAIAGAGAIPGMIGLAYLILFLMKPRAPKV